MLNKFAELVGFQIHLGLIENAGKTVINCWPAASWNYQLLIYGLA